MTARRGPMRRDLEKAAARADLTERDAAALQLARQYATAIDDARFWADQARIAAEALEGSGEATTLRRLAAVEKAVGSARVVASLGPKLLATLVALRLAGVDNAAVPEGGGQDAGSDPARAKLLEMRARRRRVA